MTRVWVPPFPPPTVSESMKILPSWFRTTVVPDDMPGPMHTSSVATGTFPDDQLPAVNHWLSPAVPVQVLVHVGAAAADAGPSGEDGEDSSGTTRVPATSSPSHGNALRLPLLAHASAERNPSHTFRLVVPHPITKHHRSAPSAGSPAFTVPPQPDEPTSSRDT